MGLKVAYLIIAHNELNILNKLIRLLDWPENTIHVLIDSKSSILVDGIYKDTSFSKVIVYTPGINISWGGSTMIDAELYLLKQSSMEFNDYYCLLSGVDLPLKNQKQIHTILEKYNGAEFIGVNKGWLKKSKEDFRYKIFHPLQNAIGNMNRKRYVLKILEKAIVGLQKPFINRWKSIDFVIEGGPQWFCITHAFCQFVLSKEDWINTTFRYTRCCDEAFMQTILVNSDYYNHIYKPDHKCYEQCCRKIDFKRGNPYIWRISDYDELMNSDAWFARKFSESVDMNIVNMISEKISKEQDTQLSH